MVGISTSEVLSMPMIARVTLRCDALDRDILGRCEQTIEMDVEISHRGEVCVTDAEKEGWAVRHFLELKCYCPKHAEDYP